MIRALLGVVLIYVATASQANADDALWDHNGSTMRLIADGNNRTIVYENPRSGMAAEGVTRGTILFQGTIKGVAGKYVGTAQIFSRRCGVKAYRVEGELQNWGDRIFLQGKAPSVDRTTCRESGVKDGDIGFDAIGPDPSFPQLPANICNETNPDRYKTCLERTSNDLCRGQDPFERLVRCYRKAIVHVYKASRMEGLASAVVDQPFTHCSNGVCTMEGGGPTNSCQRLDASSVRECDGNFENQRCEDVSCPVRQCRKVCSSSD